MSGVIILIYLFGIYLIIGIAYIILEYIYKTLVHIHDRENEKRKKEDKYEQILAMKIYDSNVNLFSDEPENLKKIEELERLYNIKDIETLRRLYNRAEQILQEERKEEYNKYLLEKKRSLIDCYEKYPSELFKARMVDKAEKGKIFDILNFKNIDLFILKDGNLKVSFNISFKDIPRIKNKKAIIDGSLKIIIYDNNKNIIADGYLNGEGFDLNNIKEIEDSAGFNERYDYNVICIPKDHNMVNQNTLYTVNFKMINMWLIEQRIQDE